jgi:hypothetical protein
LLLDRPTIATLRVLANGYGTTWDQLVDAQDLAHMPETDRLEYLESSRVPARPTPESVARMPRRRSSPDDLVAEVADESAEFGEWAGMSEVADATIDQYESQARVLARDFDLGEPVLPLLLDTRRLRDRVTVRLRGHTRLDQAARAQASRRIDDLMSGTQRAPWQALELIPPSAAGPHSDN